MTFFNFSLRTTPELEQETNNQSTLLQELEVWGHLLYATAVCETLEDMGIASIDITQAQHDYEGGIDVRLAAPIFQDNALSEKSGKNWDNWRLRDLLGLQEYTVKGYVSIQLNPTSYAGYTIENNLESTMSLICTSEIYELWKVLESKSALDTKISVAPGLQNKKAAVKI